MARWSKLQSAFYRVVSRDVRVQLQCRVVRMNSGSGSTNLPRYWITLDKETIWSYPDQFAIPGGGTKRVDSAKITYYPYVTDVPAISELIREYIDTPVGELLSKQFSNDHWGLVNILRAADRRIGQRQLPSLRRKVHNIAALKVIDARLSKTVRPSRGTHALQTSHGPGSAGSDA